MTKQLIAGLVAAAVVVAAGAYFVLAKPAGGDAPAVAGSAGAASAAPAASGPPISVTSASCKRDVDVVSRRPAR
jgi:hypothetical protein